ncbi:bifunctional PIG-L family deacetylase/class I SAM-dependent methyltransferase [Pedococcus sp. KACC 23699]|uniref:Bifunctional PIG-L family deacetylase/class I SAM-dependent methyltransferase n=1 Tax=Pedococcus sp. KACC 23699 TaxID=3149228 RepID=A0AAU7JTW0_9MICO
MTSAAPPPGFDPHAPGTPETHWALALEGIADPVEALDLLPSGSHLVVLSAHPDDESLAAGGLLAAAAALGRPATLVVATSGEGSHPRSPSHTPQRLARIREQEVAAALREVHPEAWLVLLRLPDGGLSEHQEALDAALSAVVGPGTVLAAPWRRDGHTDHEAAGAVAARVASAAGAPLLEYPVWLWHWGTTADLAGEPVVRLVLGADEQQRRAAAQRSHRSQTAALSDRPGDEVLLPEHVVERFTRPYEVFVRTLPEAGEAPAAASDAAFDAMFETSEDPWGFETSWYERRKRAVTMAALPRQQLGRVLEVGCSTGVLAAELADRATSLLATDLSAEAVRRARTRLEGRSSVEVERMRAPQQWPAGTFDLVVLSEVGYFWRPEELDEALSRSVRSLADDGLLLLCHWRHPVQGWPLDGDAVHSAAVALPGLQVVVSHVEEDFRVDVLAAGPSRSPAHLEGLA